MKRCMNCCVPDTVPNITFNPEGVCSFCRSYKAPEILGEDALMAIVGPVKRADSRYDCIVPLSGGRDSSYILYMAKAVYGLKVLAVNYDSEFRTDQALVNMRNACAALDVDFVSVHSKRNIARKLVLNSIRSSLPQGLSWNCGDVCRACMYGCRSVAYKKAEEHEVPLILWGESSAEATQDMERAAMAGLTISRMRKLLDISFYKAECCALLQRIEFRVSGNSVWPRRSIPVLKRPGTKEIRFFDYIQWDRKRIKEAITTEIGWKAPDGSISTWRTDCSLHHLINYCYLRVLGCTKDCFGYTKMICGGQMTRDEALRQELRMVASLAERVEEVLEEIGLAREEIEKVTSWDF